MIEKLHNQLESLCRQIATSEDTLKSAGLAESKLSIKLFEKE
jgi:hypothetical protein